MTNEARIAAPKTARPRIGLALGAGGARGWCHIGVLRSLDEIGCRVDVITGSSMGALVGAAYAAGQLDALETWARALTPRGVLRLLDLKLTGGGLVGGRGIMSALGEIGLAGLIEKLPVRFAAVATDISTGEEVLLDRGDLAQAVRASVSLPGVISPENLDGRWLIDGGVVNPVPVSAARALGADVVIAVNPNAAMSGSFWKPAADSATDMDGLAELLPEMPDSLPEFLRSIWGQGSSTKTAPGPSYVELVNATIDIMSDQIRRARLAGDPPHVLLPVRLPEILVLDFHRAAEAIAAGAAITRAQGDWIATVTAGASRTEA